MAPSLLPIVERVGRWIAPVVVGLVGAWLAMAAFGASDVSMGPFSVRLGAGFGRGVTDVALPPFGKLTADTHLGPMRLTATLQDVRVPELSRQFAEKGTEGIAAEVERDGLDRLGPFAVRLFVIGISGALLAAVVVFRARWRQVGVAVLAALLVVGGTEVIAWQTFRPAAFAEPTFSGSLALAPRFIGPVRDVTGRIESFRQELERVVDGALRAYTSIRSLSTDGGDVIRVLHVSDVHLSPLGTDFTREIAQGFDVDLVVDTGDLTSFGTRPEEFVLGSIRSIGRPYVFVRGNHDSRALQATMETISNAVVLDGDQREVGGLTIYGLGHPVFTPGVEASVTDREFADQARAAGERVADDVAALPEPSDIVAVHDDRMAESVAGLAPLVISGHFHEAHATVERGTLYLRIGSTGGSGFEVFTLEGGVPLSAEVLYFRRGLEPALIAYDVIEQSPESGSFTVDRHVVRREFGELVPTPPPTDGPSGASGRTNGPSGSGSPHDSATFAPPA